MRLSSLQFNQFKLSAAFEKYSKFLAENPTIEEILENPSTPEQVAIGSKILTSYLTPDMIRTLITYITIEPSENDSELRIHTYPFVSSLFFSIECGVLLDVILSNQPLLEDLLNFLKGEAPLNFLLSGYFARAFDSLFRLNERKLLDFIYSQGYHQCLLNHIYSQSIADISYKCLSSSFTFKQQRIEMIDVLVSKLNVDYSPLVALNSQSILSRSLNDCFPGIEYLANYAVLNTLFSNLCSENKDVVVSSAKVLYQLLNTFKDEESVFLRFLANFEKFRDIIFKDEMTVLKNQAGCSASAIGESKLIAMQIVNILCGIHSSEAAKCIACFEIIPKLTNLFEDHDWNSLYHERYYNIVETIVYSDSYDLQLSLFDFAKLPQLLIKLGNSPYVQYGNYPLKRGSLGYIYKMANLLISSSHKGIIAPETLSEIEGWSQFEKEVIDVYNKVANSELGCVDVFESASSEGNNETEDPNLLAFNESDTNQIEIISMEETNTDENKVEFFENVYWKIELDVNDLEEIA